MRCILIFFVLTLLSCGEDQPHNRKMYDDSVKEADSVARNDSITHAQLAASSKVRKVDTSTVYDSSIYLQYIPDKILRYRSEKIPEWKLLSPDHWEKYWFNKYLTDSSLVNFAEGDFNCDGSKDYALMLLDDRDDQLGVWVISDQPDGMAAELVMTLDKASPMQYGIATVNEKTIEDMYDSMPVRICGKGIDFEKFESASRIYYYDNGEYKFVQTSD
ncbi:MAG TPA: hypothetical protein VL651_02400 [Bacteroidia bacterium]|jgi:hypothetical protein|nr:hypothetical protein [Bacteroidia bacterium]